MRFVVSDAAHDRATDLEHDVVSFVLIRQREHPGPDDGTGPGWPHDRLQLSVASSPMLSTILTGGTSPVSACSESAFADR